MRKVLRGKRVLEVERIVLSDGTELPVEMKLLAYIPRKVDRDKYVKVYQDYILEAVVQNKLKRTDLTIFMWFVSHNDWGNDWIHVDYEELSKELGVRKETIIRSLKRLVDANLLVQYKPREKLFKLNPRYVYKGGVVGKEQDIDF